MPPPTLIIADDHPLFRAALHGAVCKALPGVSIVEASELHGLQKAAETHTSADLILLDLHMPGARGLSALVYLRAQHPAIPVVIVSAVEEPAIIRRAMDFGASGYIPKSATLEQIGQALLSVLGGAVWLPPSYAASAANTQPDEDGERARKLSTLTPQQLRVLLMLADGMLNKQIAADLGLAEATVKTHVTAILRKLGVHRRTQVALMAQHLLQAEDVRFVPEELGDE